MKTLAEIQAQIAELQIEEERIRNAELSVVIAEIKNKMALYHLTSEDLNDEASTYQRKPKAPVAAKYRNPVDGSTWSGRGNLPNWLKLALAENRSRDEFLIEVPSESVTTEVPKEISEEVAVETESHSETVVN